MPCKARALLDDPAGNPPPAQPRPGGSGRPPDTFYQTLRSGSWARSSSQDVAMVFSLVSSPFS